MYTYTRVTFCLGRLRGRWSLCWTNIRQIKGPRKSWKWFLTSSGEKLEVENVSLAAFFRRTKQTAYVHMLEHLAQDHHIALENLFVVLCGFCFLTVNQPKRTHALQQLGEDLTRVATRGYP